VGRSSPVTPTSSSPDRLDPSQVDDSDWSDRECFYNRLAAVPALALVVVLLPIGILTVAVLERWRAWRGKD
jgi:hypothetical protein